MKTLSLKTKKVIAREGLILLGILILIAAAISFELINAAYYKHMTSIFIAERGPWKDYAPTNPDIVPTSVLPDEVVAKERRRLINAGFTPQEIAQYQRVEPPSIFKTGINPQDTKVAKFFIIAAYCLYLFVRIFIVAIGYSIKFTKWARAILKQQEP